MNETLKITPFNPKEIVDRSDFQRAAIKAFGLLSSPDCFSSDIHTFACDGYSFSIVSRNNMDIFTVEICILERKRLKQNSIDRHFSLSRCNPAMGRQEISFWAIENGKFWDINHQDTTEGILEGKKRKPFIDSFLEAGRCR